MEVLCSLPKRSSGPGFLGFLGGFEDGIDFLAIAGCVGGKGDGRAGECLGSLKREKSGIGGFVCVDRGMLDLLKVNARLQERNEHHTEKDHRQL